MFCRKFGWPSMKVLQIKVKINTDLSCSDVHWNFWRMCNALRLGSEVCNWYRLATSPIWRRRSTNVKKKSTVFILHFAPSLRFTLSLQSVFYTQSAIYPWSAICSLQSAVCVLHWPISNSLLNTRAQLFEGRLALNPGLNLTRISFSCVQKHFLG